MITEQHSARVLRLDQAVLLKQPEITRAFAAKLISGEKVTVNGIIVTKAGYKMREHDSIAIDYDHDLAVQLPPEIDLEVLYEDADCIVINKPVGILSHSKGAYNPEPTVSSFAQVRGNLSGERAGIVHRLDRATSGVMICAKTEDAMSWLQKQFSQRRVKKTYFAVVQGAMKEIQAVIDMPIERNPKAPASFRVGINGKRALTSYEVISASEKYSLLQLKPETGRTHQLRVHLKELGHPIVGDIVYGGEAASRMMLHAAELEITLPNKQRQTFSVSMPTIFKNYV